MGTCDSQAVLKLSNLSVLQSTKSCRLHVPQKFAALVSGIGKRWSHSPGPKVPQTKKKQNAESALSQVTDFGVSGGFDPSKCSFARIKNYITEQGLLHELGHKLKKDVHVGVFLEGDRRAHAHAHVHVHAAIS
eukprot:2578409-Amphidinium_carterae.1